MNTTHTDHILYIQLTDSCLCVSGRDSITRFSDACAVATVDVEARGCDEETSMVCCSAEGCYNETAANVSTSLIGCLLCGGYDPLKNLGCWIKYSFGEPQDLVGILIEFDEATENTRTFYFYVDGRYEGVITAAVGTKLVYHIFGPNTDAVSQVRLSPGYEESYSDMWLDIKRVRTRCPRTRYT